LDPRKAAYQAAIPGLHFWWSGLDGVGWPRPPTKKALMHAFVPEVLNGHEYRVCTILEILKISSSLLIK